MQRAALQCPVLLLLCWDSPANNSLEVEGTSLRRDGAWLVHNVASPVEDSKDALPWHNTWHESSACNVCVCAHPYSCKLLEATGVNLRCSPHSTSISLSGIQVKSLTHLTLFPCEQDQALGCWYLSSAGAV